MKKIAVIICFSLGCGNALAGNWYAGFGFGASKALNASSNLDSDIEPLSAFGISSSISADEGAHAFSILGGFQVNKNIGIEVSYDYLGNYQASLAASGSGGSVAANEEDKVSAVSIAGILTAPINQTFSVFGKAGLAQTTNDMNCTATAPGCTSASDSKSGPIVGIGGSLAFNGGSLRLEYDRINDVGDKNNQYTAGNFSLLKLEALYIF